MARMTKKQKFKQISKFYKSTKKHGIYNVPKSELKPKKEWINPDKPSSKPESAVLKEVRSLLSSYGMFVLRRSSGLFYTQWGGRINVGCNGEADLEALADKGKVVFVECKSGSGGYLSEAQIEFRDKVESLGHKYIVVCSATEAKVKVLNALSEVDFFEREDNE